MISEIDLTDAGIEFTRNADGRITPHGPPETAAALGAAVRERTTMVESWLESNTAGMGRPPHRYGECESCRQPIPNFRGGNCWICCCCIQTVLDTRRQAEVQPQEKMEEPPQNSEDPRLPGLSVTQQAAALSLFEGLNPEQVRVMQHGDGPCLVAACAGSGKTTAVVRRMAYLVKVRGVRPDRIFGTTFSRKAAAEMNTRIKHLLGDQMLVQVQTFHAFCWRVLKEEFSGIGQWQLDDTDRYRDIIKRAVGYEHMNWAKADIEELSEYIELAKAAAYWPGSREAMVLAMSRYESQRKQVRDPTMVAAAYAKAEELRTTARIMTFADWMMEVDKLFKDENVRTRWAALFDHVMVDEAQDNSLVQVNIAASLAKDHRNLMLIGDAAQSIYRWRGAAPEYFNGFSAQWDAPIISMFRNYRSTKPVIDFANTILSSMRPEDRVGDTSMECERLGSGDGSVTVRSQDTVTSEAEAVVNHIQSLHVDGAPWNNTVVLYRVNALSRAIEEELNRKEVPYKVVGSTSFYLRREVSTLLCYLRVAWRKGATLDDVRRSLFSPHRMLGKVFFTRFEEATRTSPGPFSAMVEAAIEASAVTKRLIPQQASKARSWAQLIDSLRDDVATAATANGEWLGEGLPQWNPSKMLEKIVKETDYYTWLRNDEGRETPDNDRVSNVAELIRVAGQFRDTGAFLKHANEQVAIAKEKRDDGETGDCVTLMSVHRSKGLEWPHVFLISCNEGVLPHVFADDKEEERRIFYVAATRAMDTLNISYCTTDGNSRQRLPSRFLDSLMLDEEKAHERLHGSNESDEPAPAGPVPQVIPIFGKRDTP